MSVDAPLSNAFNKKVTIHPSLISIKKVAYVSKTSSALLISTQATSTEIEIFLWFLEDAS